MLLFKIQPLARDHCETSRFRRARRALLGLSLASLAACGFSPVYAPDGAGEGLKYAIYIQEPDTRNEFTFVSHLETRLGRAQAAPYLLGYKIHIREEGVGITPTQEITRYNVFGTVAYTLTDRATKKVVHSGQVDNFTGYSATSLIVGSESVTRDANERLMVILADQVTARLIATSKDWLR